MWIESHASLYEHQKTRKAARLLGVSAPTVMGHLHCLWHWALTHAEDGSLAGLEPDEVAYGAKWDGDPAKLIEALLGCGKASGAGFLEKGEEGALRLHDWGDYAGKLMAKRAANAQRARTSRERRAQQERDDAARADDVTRTCEATVQNSTEPDSTQPDLTGPEEEDGPVPAEEPPKRKRAKKVKADPAEFDQFWLLVPKREGKGQARKAFAKARESVGLDAILVGARLWAKKRDGEDPQYTQRPSTWLADEGWADESLAPVSRTLRGPSDRSIQEREARARARAQVIREREEDRNKPRAPVDPDSTMGRALARVAGKRKA